MRRSGAPKILSSSTLDTAFASFAPKKLRTTKGPINYTDIEKHLLEERNIEGLAYKEFIDASDAGLVFALSPSEIRQTIALVRHLGQQVSFGPTAVLVSSDFAFGIMSAMEVLLEDVAEIRSFRQEKLARSWLASRPPLTPPP